MPSDLLPIALLIAAGAVLYVLREWRRWRLAVRPPRPDLPMMEAWTLWRSGLLKHPDSPFIPSAAAPDANPGHMLAVVEERLLEIEKLCLAGAQPRLDLRRAILRSASASLHLEAIEEQDEDARCALLEGYTAGMGGLLRDWVRSATMEWIVLRQYARLKHDDATPRDWFHHFLWLARPYIREKVRLSREFVLHLDESAGRFVEAYDAILAELEQGLLKAPPKKRFVPPDLPYAAGTSAPVVRQ